MPRSRILVRGNKVQSQAAGPELVLGTAQLVQAYGIAGNATPRSSAEAIALLRRAHELGIRRLDTAAAYGEAERTIGESGLRFLVDTKVARGNTPARSLEQSLARLGTDSVQVLYLHDPSCLQEAGRETIQLAAATIGHGAEQVGVSVYEWAEVEAALQDASVGAVQFPASLLDRRTTDALLDTSAPTGVDLYIRSVFLQGAVLAPPALVDQRVPGLGRYVEAAHRAAKELDRSVQELALQWARSLPGVSGVIVGADSEAQLEQLVAAWNALPLQEDEFRLVDRLPTPPPKLVDPRTWTTR